jgi:predicted HicB family RNase H-like nuclease
MNKDLKYYLNLPYKTVLEYEPDDKTWVAYCPDLGRGTCYAIGESKLEALRLLEESKKIILEYALEEGKEIPEPALIDDEDLPSGNFIIRVPKTTHRKLKVEAENEGVSLNQYVLSVLSEHIGIQIAKSKYTKTNKSEYFSGGYNLPPVLNVKSPGSLGYKEKENSDSSKKSTKK